MKFIDTNIFLRYLTSDDKDKYLKCKQLFEKMVKGEEILFTTELVIIEIIWTLLSYYKVSKKDVVEKVSIILNTPNLKVTNHKILLEAIGLYDLKDIDFIDAYNAILMRHNGIKTIYSYDRDFDKLDFTNRQEP